MVVEAVYLPFTTASTRERIRGEGGCNPRQDIELDIEPMVFVLQHTLSICALTTAWVYILFSGQKKAIIGHGGAGGVFPIHFST